jgi:lysozyme
MTNLKAWIKKCEGLKLHPYEDTTGKTTIGYGRNLEDNGITPEEAEFMFENDFDRCEDELRKFSWYVIQPSNVQAALINMCFNIGISKLLGFKKMIMALTVQDYTTAALEALNSEWAAQVGERAKDIALMIRQGK